MDTTDLSQQTPTLGIGRLLREGGRFVVPEHQRDYSWTVDEVEKLFSDIKEARLSPQPEYFIGLMVFMPKAKRKYTILDGQQRIATTAIILASIRSWLKARGHDRDAGKIQDRYIGDSPLGKSDFQPTVELNANNNASFYEHVVQESPTKEIRGELSKLKKYDPNRKLLEAIIYCRSKIEELASGSGRPSAQDRLFELVAFLEDGVKIVRLNVPNEMNAYTVFETLNDRGLDLSALDLVKNYLFGRSATPSRLKQVQARWAPMVANLTAVKADDFLKAWWTSRHGRVQAAQLYAKFRDSVSTAREVTETSKDMLVVSEQYPALEVADDPLWSGYSKSARDRIRALKLLGGRQAHPVLLSAVARWRRKEIERLLRLMEVVIVRYQLIGGRRTGRLEISCASLAHQIYKGKVKTATSSKRVLKDVLPDDSEFREAFKTKQEKNNSKASYILSKLEGQARAAAGGRMSRELQAGDSLTVEHILPKNPGARWKTELDADPEFAEDCTFMLGNMCLLTDVNRSLGNKSFPEKRGVYAKSSLELTNMLGAKRSWSRKAIEHRQAKMAKLAVALWRFQ